MSLLNFPKYVLYLAFFFEKAVFPICPFEDRGVVFCLFLFFFGWGVVLKDVSFTFKLSFNLKKEINVSSKGLTLNF